ncbi:MAG: radical SAM protein [Elusimicrobia bacterium]|nr:radical SAM protein [Elusimicrobiota bacterium]
MRILLLNPPGDQVYLRDYYCSKVSKADYLYEPLDLLMLSGILKREHDLKVIDAIAMRSGPKETLCEILDFAPEAVVFVSGAVSFERDRLFLQEVKDRTRARMIGSGDLFLDNPAQYLGEDSPVDAVLLDFTDESVLDYLKGHVPCRNIVCRAQAGIVSGPVVRGKGEEFHLPQPDHSLFPIGRYQYPFVRDARFATVLTDYGCPFHCSFCVMSGIGFKLRDVDSVIEELRTLKNRGVREIYFDDQTFAARRKRTRDLLERMIIEKLNMGWCCFTRVDVVDEEMLSLMKRAGCHTIMFGVESADQAMLDRHQKGIRIDRVSGMIRACVRLRISTVATFIIGLPGDTRDSIERTVRYALSCGCDFASFNIAVPRAGTPLREESVRDGLLAREMKDMDQSGSRAFLKTGNLAPEEIERLKDAAVRRFYGRPFYLLHQLFRITSFYDLKRKIGGFFAIIRRSSRRRKEGDA